MEFWAGMFAGAAIMAIGIAGATVLELFPARTKKDDIWEWDPEAYEPRVDQPRAITRITSNQIDWEIK
jgi:hypothetical protein